MEYVDMTWVAYPLAALVIWGAASKIRKWTAPRSPAPLPDTGLREGCVLPQCDSGREGEDPNPYNASIRRMLEEEDRYARKQQNRRTPQEETRPLFEEKKREVWYTAWRKAVEGGRFILLKCDTGVLVPLDEARSMAAQTVKVLVDRVSEGLAQQGVHEMSLASHAFPLDEIAYKFYYQEEETCFTVTGRKPRGSSRPLFCFSAASNGDTTFPGASRSVRYASQGVVITDPQEVERLLFEAAARLLFEAAAQAGQVSSPDSSAKKEGGTQ